MKFLEEKFVPLAAKIGSQKHLACIRDSFTVMMPLTIAGALGVLFANVSGIFAETGLNMPAIAEGYTSFLNASGLGTVFSNMNNGTINCIAILLVGMLAGSLTEANGGDRLAGTVTGLSSFLCGLGWNQVAGVDFGAGNGVINGVSYGGAIIDAQLIAANGLFVAMLFGLFVGEIFPRLSSNEKLKITMPDGVPPAVAKSFSSLIPAIITVALSSAIYAYLLKFTGQSVFQLITRFLSAPLANLSQNVFMIIIMYFMIGLLWVFGLHGANIVGSVTTPILTPLSLENVTAFANHEEPKNTVVAELQSGFAFLGGSGATIGCIIAIFLFSKSKASKTIANLALAPGIFEINEPLTFGLPIVLNVALAIPFIFGPVILGVITYFIMEAGIIRRPCIQAPWVTPPILIGFLCTGGDIKGAIWNIIEMVGLTALWTPFIMVNDRTQGAE